MANTYCTATNFGKGFFTHEDRNDFYLSGHAGDVWVVGNNAAGVSWINRVTGTGKTKAEAQAFVDGKMDEAIVAWNALSAVSLFGYTIIKTALFGAILVTVICFAPFCIFNLAPIALKVSCHMVSCISLCAITL